jgi:uncharacterized protein (DUF1015 family)
MAVIHPFRALRPPAELVAQVASVPYDVVNTEEARALAAGNPWSFLHVSRPEIDLPPGTDIHSEDVYKKASDNFRELIDRCPLKTDPDPGLYLYRLIMGEHEQIGVVTCCAVDEYDDNTILKHEKTRPDKEDDRTRHMLALHAQTGPVFLTYRGNQDIDTMVMEVTVTEAVYDFTAPDGVQHTVWHVPDAVRFVQAFREIPKFYIADGHHRAASASRARKEMKELHEQVHTGDEEYNFFLAVLFPAEQLQILPYNRIVRDLNGLSQEQFLDRVSEKFDVVEEAKARPERGQWSMYMNGRWYGLTLKDALGLEVDDPVASLDVSVLQENLLDPILGIKDVRTDKRIDFVGGIRGTEELERLVNDGSAAVAFSLSPTTIDDLLSVSDAGSIMPPKSTWFEPKLRDALLIHVI